MEKRLPIYQSVVTLFFLFVSFGGTYWEQGTALIGYVFGRQSLYGAILFKKEKSNRMVLRRRYFSNNSTVFNESDSFLNMEKHRCLVFRNLLFNL